MDDVREFWPDFKPDEPNFWKHEWEKHGTCARMSSQREYFETTIRLVKDMDIMNVLEKDGIVPDNEKRVNLNSMLNSIEKGVGHRPFVVCKQQYIQEMRFCFDKDLKGYNCKSRNEGCDNNVILNIAH